MARKSLSELREEMRAVARGERKVSRLPAQPPRSPSSRARLSSFWPFCCTGARRA